MPTGIGLERLLFDALSLIKHDIAEKYLNQKPWASLEQLAKWDHPYAKRHGKDGNWATTAWTYRRSGTAERSVMLKRTLGSAPLSSRASVRLTYDLTDAKYLKYVFRGTKVMIARDPIRMGLYDDWQGDERWEKELISQIRWLMANSQRSEARYFYKKARV